MNLGVSNAFDTDPIISDRFDSDDEISNGDIRNDSGFLPRPFSPGFGQLKIDEELTY